MRRDHFTAAVLDVDSGKPSLTISYDGPEETLAEQLTDDSGETYDQDEIDAAYRLHESISDEGASGVFSLTHRITGDYLIEVNVDADEMLTLIRTARDVNEDEELVDTSYSIRIDRDAAETVVYDMDALFVYDDDGELLRQHSLIPSGVEL